MKTLAQPLLVLSLLVTLSTAQLHSQTASFNGTYTQNFNSTFTTAPTGWTVHVGNVGPTQTLIDGNTSNANVNTAFSYGPSGDRALGLYTNRVFDDRSIRLSFQNNSGAALSQLFISYDLEAWISTFPSNLGRQGGFALEFSTNGTSWVSMGNNFNALVTNANITNSPNAPFWLTTPITQSITNQQYSLPTMVAEGAAFFLRWNGSTSVLPDLFPLANNSQNNRVGTFLDNVQISSSSLIPAPIPEPSAYAAILAGLCASLIAFRRSKKSLR